MPLLEELNYMPTEKYAHGKELLGHAQRIGHHYNLYSKALFQTEVNSVTWDEEAARWTVETSRGDRLRARFFFAVAGPLYRPKLPVLEGIKDFKGHAFHSSRWDYAYTGGDQDGGLEKLKDKRVGLIGTGATAMQIVPHLGEWAKELYVFQRTPSSVDFRANRPTDPAWAASLKPGWQMERMVNFNNICAGLHEDEDLVADGWTDIFTKIGTRPRPGKNFDPVKAAAKRQIADFKKMESVRARCDEVVRDRETAESLKPWYNQLCKRPCFHDEYLQTFNRPSVHLVDTKGVGVSAITEKGVVANGKEYELDCIIYATGFDISFGWAERSGVTVTGRNGLTLGKKYKDGAVTLQGWTTHGFPNCFWVGVTHAALTPNFLHMTREQADHFAYVLAMCRDRKIRTIEATEEAEQKWTDTIVERMKPRDKFHETCTPGYYNNEGRRSLKTARNGSYGDGPAFIEILKNWRQKGGLDGVQVTTFPI